MVQDPVLTIQNLLVDNWNTSNTSIGYRPSIHTGWIDSAANQPQITITSASESPMGFGTPYSGIKPDGSGPTQRMMGTIAVGCWSNREVEPRVNPKKLTYEMSEEVRRIVHANVNSATDLETIGYNGRMFLVDEDSEGVWFRYQVTVWYTYCILP